MATGEGKVVCVTGVSGYIGAHVVKVLLERGHRVRGTVRSLDDEAKTAWIRALAEGTPGQLELVSADLLDPASLDRAVEGCEFVAHTASAVQFTSKDPQKDIVDVAVDGTRNVLNAIVKAKCAKRVVVTSSIAAVLDKTGPLNGEVFTEEDWNRNDVNLSKPYHTAKTLAERVVWEIYEKQPKDGSWRFEVVTVLPAIVLGPLLDKQHLRTSPGTVLNTMNGNMALGTPFFSWNLVDVREVALAHAVALENPKASGRYLLCTATPFRQLEIAATIREKYPNLKLPTRYLPSFLLYGFSLFNKQLAWDLVTEMVEQQLISGKRAEAELGIVYRPEKESILATADSIMEMGLLHAKP